MIRRILVIIICFDLLFNSCAFFENKSVILPFNYDRNLYFKCKINDVEGNFMFDTGAYGLYLDSLYNKRSGLEFGNYYSTMNDGNSFHPNFSSGTISYHPSSCQIINIKPAFGKDCDGIVGWDFLENKVLEINYVDSNLTVTNSSDFKADKSYTKIPLSLRENKIYLNVEIKVSENLKIKGDYLLDLGYGGSVMFTNESTRKYQIDTVNTKRMYFGTNWGSLGGKSNGFVSRGKVIKIADFELTNPLIDCAKDESGVLSAGEYIGLIGNRVWENYSVIIDFKEHFLYLKPNKNFNKKMKFTRSGASSTDRTDICEGWIVSFIFSNSNAEKSGIQTGDIITHVNDKPVKGIPTSVFYNIVKGDEKEILYTLKRGNQTFTVNLVYKDYL